MTRKGIKSNSKQQDDTGVKPTRRTAKPPLTKRAQKWRNRIIGSALVPASELLANPSNWRVHPQAQQDALKGALDSVGWVQEVIVNKATGHIVDGHLRVSLALRAGDSTPVPVKYVELSEAEEKLALSILDPIAAMAGADKEQLQALLSDINTDNAAIQSMLSELGKKAGIVPDFQPVGEDEQGDLDSMQAKTVVCPSCGHEFAI